MVHGQNGRDRLDCARAAQHVAGHGLSGADHDLVGILFAKDDLERLGLGRVVERCACAVSIDVYLRRIDAAAFDPGILDRFRASLCFRIRSRHVVSVACGAVAAEFSVDLSSSRLRVFVFFKDHRAGALADDESASVLMERQAGPVHIVGLVQRAHLDEAGNAGSGDRSLSTAGDHHVSVSVADRSQCLSQGVGPGSACGYCRQSRSLHAVADRDGSRAHVGDHHRDEVRRYESGAFGQILLEYILECGDAADTGAEIYAGPLRIEMAFDAAVLDRLDGSRQTHLHVAVGSADLGLVHVLFRIEVFDFCSDLHREIRRIEQRDRTDPVLSCDQIVPKGLNIIAQRGDRAKTCYNYSSVVHNNNSPLDRDTAVDLDDFSCDIA